MSQPVAGVPYAFTYRPRADGQPYDPQPAGGAVTRLEVLTTDGSALVLADVGPAPRIAAGEYRFPPVALPAGSYDARISFIPAAGAETFVDIKPIVVLGLGGSLDEDVPAWTPSVEEVERHIPTRGPFDETSRPTRQQIEQLALSRARGLQLELAGKDLSPVQVQVARSYVEHAVAARVEWNWYPEQQDQDSAGRQHDMWATAELTRLRSSLGLTAMPGTGSGSELAPAPAPVGAFPPAQPWPDSAFGYDDGYRYRGGYGTGGL